MRIERIELPAPSPGTSLQLRLLRFGTAGARPKAYLQAGLHGGELPGMLVLAKLEELLLEAEADILGEIVIVPVASPIGTGQSVMGVTLGRFDLFEMTNFNRGWPDPFDELAAAVEGRVGPDPVANVAAVRTAWRELAEAMPWHGTNGALRRALYGEAIDADLVLDLHCDLEAVMHLYLGTPLWPSAADLAAELGAAATLLAEESGGEPFDEALSTPWWQLQRHFPDHPIPLACLAATIELRGMRDVDEALAEQDARALFRFLQRRGLIRGKPGALAPLSAEATPLTGVAMVRAPHAGLVSFRERPGAVVEAGRGLATLIDPRAPPGSRRSPILAPIAGLLFARTDNRLVRPGEIVLKIAGATPLPERKGRLLDD